MGDDMPNIHYNVSFGLVDIPVIVNPLIRNNDTRFNQLHKKCHNRIKYIKYCSHCKKEVKESDIIKGYEVSKGYFLTFDKSEISRFKTTNMREIEIISFVPLKEIEPYYFERTYVLEPANRGKSYYLLLEAMKKTKLVAIGKTTIGSKFYYTVLRLTYNKIIMSTMFFEEEINLKKENVMYEVSQKELELAIKLINNFKSNFKPEEYIDLEEVNIKKAIDAKIKGKKVKSVSKKNNKRINDLLEALEKSLNEKK